MAVKLLAQSHDPPLLIGGRGRDVRAELASRLSPSVSKSVSAALTSPESTRFLEAVFDHSAYLGRLGLRHPDLVAACLSRDPDALLEEVWARFARDSAAADREAEIMAVLRRAKQEVALVVALADLAEAWPLEKCCTALTRLADEALNASLNWALRQAAAGGKLDLPNPDDPQEACGLAVIAMGKYGAGELNYSSDIDLVVIFDAAVLPVRNIMPQAMATKLTQSLVRLLNQQTSDGYVFRVDLRLRPDPGSTQVAVARGFAQVYYETYGQNWERAAYIKARHAAGDKRVGRGFLDDLTPFIWRRTLDFDAIEDIHSIKRQIRSSIGDAHFSLSGHNLKLGRGGIREIEFFAQTQQLIIGGREVALRVPQTLKALQALHAHDLIDGQALQELSTAYRRLRMLEHRLQMIDDQQTHSLPREQGPLRAFARFSGFRSHTVFEETVIGTLLSVHTHYAVLFEDAPPLAEDVGNLVFTGVEADPETVETLQSLGFQRPEDIWRIVRLWHQGGRRATKSVRARQTLTALMPMLLQAFGQTVDPDQGFLRFDDLLTDLPGGVQFLALLHANPHLLELFAEILGTAPSLSGFMARNPAVIDSLLDRAFWARLEDAGALESELAEVLAHAPHYEDALDLARRWVRERSFRHGVQVLTNKRTAIGAGQAYSDLAEAAVRALLPVVQADMAQRHGHVPGAEFAVLALGRLGSSEMTARSDLDLICVYRAGADSQSDGAAPLAAATYFTRLSQRLISALSAPTAEGKLFDVDMRLRPSGNKGPLAASLEAFLQYQHQEAWTWEHLALTRARPVAGDPALCAALAGAIRDILTLDRAPAALAADVNAMRERLARMAGRAGPWDLKTVPGGLMDLGFLVQALLLRHAHAAPESLNPCPRLALAALGEGGFLPDTEVTELTWITDFFNGVAQLLTLAVTGPFDPAQAPLALKQRLCRVADADDFESLEADLRQAQARVLALYDTHIGTLGRG